MTAPVLSPVRWWRDDAERYHSRPLIGVCRTEPESWPFDVLLAAPARTPSVTGMHARSVAAAASMEMCACDWCARARRGAARLAHEFSL